MALAAEIKNIGVINFAMPHVATPGGLGPDAGANTINFPMGRLPFPIRIIAARVIPGAQVAADADATTFSLRSGDAGATVIGSVTNAAAAIPVTGTDMTLTSDVVVAADTNVTFRIANVADGQALTANNIICQVQYHFEG